MRFDWDPSKASSNWSKHGVAFEEAGTVFDDLLSVTVEDSLHSDNEERLVTIGTTEFGRLIVVVHVEYGDVIRIISARRATRQERRTYERGE